MAEDCVDHAITLGRIRDAECTTKHLKIHGYLQPPGTPENSEDHLDVYGSDAQAIRALAQEPTLAVQINPELPYIAAEVVWAARTEMARTVEDILARRTRALFLNARAAIAMAEPVAGLLAAELGRNEAWAASQISEFRDLAKQYMV
jgi:glycerol-3-phosphate dehydrogenase